MTDRPDDVEARWARNRRVGAIIGGSLLIGSGLGYEVYSFLMNAWPMTCGFFFVPVGVALLIWGLAATYSEPKREPRGFDALVPVVSDTVAPSSPQPGDTMTAQGASSASADASPGITHESRPEP